MSFKCKTYLKELKKYQKMVKNLRKKDYAENLISLLNPLNDLLIEKQYLLNWFRRIKNALEFYPLTEKERKFLHKQKKLISEELKRIELFLKSVSKRKVN